MTKRSRAVLFLCLAAVILSAGITFAQVFARKRWDQVLRESGYPHAQTKHVVLYIDGLVARHIQLNDRIYVDKAYMQGNPLRLFFAHPDRIWVHRADLDIRGLFRQSVAWPIPKASSFEIENLNIRARLWDRDIVMAGALKQDNSARAVFSLHARDAGIQGNGQGEIILGDERIKTVNFEWDGSYVSINPMDARRVIGWFALDNKGGPWRIAGEANAGSLDIGDLHFLDSSLKLTGKLTLPVISFSAVNLRDKDVWVVDRRQSGLLLQHGASEKVYPVRLSDKADIVRWTRALAKDVRKATPDTNKPVVAVVRKSEEKAETVAMEAPESVAAQVAFAQLVKASLLRGFFYTRPLILLPQACPVAPQHECWMARGIGGELSYDSASMPPYLQRLKNYEQAVLLRDVMHQVKVDFITLAGHGDTAETLVIKGRTKDGQPVHITLSVDDAE